MYKNFTCSLRHSKSISTGQKMKFSIKDFFSKCDQIRRKLRIWSYLLKKSLMKNVIFCAVKYTVRWGSNLSRENIGAALLDLVPVVQFKKREKHRWRIVTLLKLTLLHGFFSRFSNCTRSTKSRKASHLLLGP